MVKRVIQFAVVTISLYLILIAPWPGFGKAYLRAYRAAAGTVFHQFGSQGTLWFLPPDKETPQLDTLVVCKKSGVDQRYTITMQDAWTTAYLPTVKVVALILATPISWRRRGIALFFGLCTVQFFIGLRLLIVLVQALSTPSPVQLFEPGETATWFLNGLHEHFCISTGPVFLVPVLIWIVSTIRREDLQHFLDTSFSRSRVSIERGEKVASSTGRRL